jgi:hypothetical protein
MTKAEIKAKLKAEGLFDKTGNKNPTWSAAFDEYRRETGMKLCNCSGSYNRLRSWMNS